MTIVNVRVLKRKLLMSLHWGKKACQLYTSVPKCEGT
jgi:hypothetical protein